MIVTLRMLGALSLGALVALLGALFLGEYEFDETLPVVAGPILGLIMAEVVVSVGGVRTRGLAVMLAVGAFIAVLLAGSIDANGVEPIKSGAYVSAALAAVAAGVRAVPWGDRSA